MACSKNVKQTEGGKLDLSREQPIPFSDVPHLPWLQRRLQGTARGRRKQRIHVATVFRWASRGIRGHRLEFVQVGGTRCTTEAALLRFFDALTSKDHPPPPKRDRELVERELDKAGL